MHYRNIWNEVPEPKVENTPSRLVARWVNLQSEF